MRREKRRMREDFAACRDVNSSAPKRLPASVTAPARSVRREVPKLSRTLATMESYRLRETAEGEGRQKAPRVTFDELNIVYRPRLGAAGRRRKVHAYPRTPPAAVVGD